MGIIDLGVYKYQIELDSAKFKRAMEDAQRGLANFHAKTAGVTKVIGGVAVGAVAGLGVALAGAGIAGVKSALDMDNAFRKLQASTGATDKEMQGLKETATNLYNAGLGESMEDVANALATVKQNTGLTGKSLESLTQDAMNLGETFDLDVAESSRTAKAMMEQFGISGHDAMNLVAQGAQNGANKNGDLLDSLNEYSPQFAAMGFSASQFTNVLIDGAKNGAFSIDKVGDAMKEFNIRSKDGSKTSADAFKSLGFNANEMTKNFAKGGDTAQQSFGKVITALNNVKDPVEKNRIGVELFGTQFEDLEAKGIAAFANIGNNANLSKDAIGKINEIRFNSFGEAFQVIGRNMQTAFIQPLQQHLLPLLSNFSSYIISNMPQIKQAISSAFSGIGKIIDTTVTVFSSLKKTFTETNASTSSNFNKVKSTISSIFNTIKGIFKDFTSFATTIWKKYGSDLVKYASTSFKALSQTISGVLKVVRGVIKTVLSLITGDWRGAWTGLKTLTSGLLQTITGLVRTAVNTIKAVFKAGWAVVNNIFSVVLKGLGALVKSIFGGMGTSISSTMTKIGSSIKTGWNNAKTAVSTAITNMKTSVSTGFNNIITSSKTIFSKVKSTVSKPFEDAKTAIISTMKKIDLKSIGKNIVQGLINGISGMVGSVKKKAKEIADSVKNTIKSALDIHSPSRDTKKLGVYAGQGLAIGIASTKKQNEKESKKIADSVKKKFDEAFKNADYKFDMKKINATQYIAELQRIAKAYAKTADQRRKVNLEIKKVEDQITKDKAKKEKAEADAKAKKQKEAEEKRKAQYEKEKKMISDKKDLGLLSLTQELKAWEVIQRKYKKGSEERLEAEKEILRIKKELIQAQFQAEKDRIDKRKYYDNLSLPQELKLLEQYAKEYKAGSEEREYYEREAYRVKKEILAQLDSLNENYTNKIQETNDKLREDEIKAEEEYNNKISDIKQRLIDDELKAKEDYEKEVQSINQKLIDEEKRLTDEYEKTVEDRTKSIYSFVGLFDEVKHKEVTGEQLLANLDDQVRAVGQWRGNIRDLRDRGLNEELLQELQNMGPQAADEIKALTTLSDKELDRYVNLWQAKNSQARLIANVENLGLRKDTQNQIDQLREQTSQQLEQANQEYISKVNQLRTDANNEMEKHKSEFVATVTRLRIEATDQISKLKTEWQAKLKEISEGTKPQFDNLPVDMNKVGQDTIKGLIEGMKAMIPTLTTTTENISKVIEGTVKKALKIKSPSRVMKVLGGFVGEGFAWGIEDEADNVEGSANLLISKLLNMQDSLSNLFSPTSYTFGASSARMAVATATSPSTVTTNNHQTIHVNPTVNFNVNGQLTKREIEEAGNKTINAITKNLRKRGIR